MKGKVLIKSIAAIFSVIAVASCIQTVDPSIVMTEAAELQQLDEYLDTLQNRGLDVDTTSMGVYYVVDVEGEGPYPGETDTCIVKYEGFLLSSGVVFDASLNHNPTDSTYTYVMSDTNVIPGWRDGMRVINKGARVFLIIPSSLAYGEYGNNYNIGPYETLIFQVDMVDIK